MATNVLDTVLSLAGHVRRHPELVVNVARHALHRRVAIPLDAIRWALAQLPPKKAPKELTLTGRAPALHVDALVEVMNNPLRVAASIFVEQVRLGGDELRLVLRLADVEAEALNPKSPLAQLLRPGGLDLSKPANLLNLAPKRPPVIAAAKDDILELDLMKVPKFKDNAALRKALAAIAPVLLVEELRTEEDWLLVRLRPVPSGLRDAITAVRA